MRGSTLVLLASCGRVGFDLVPGEASALTYRDAVLADAPVSYWRFADAGLTARDELGVHPGTYTGGCSHSAGALAGDPDLSATFDAVTCKIDFGETFEFAGSAPFTVEIWARPTRSNGFLSLFVRETRNASNPIDGYGIVKAFDGYYAERSVDVVNVTTTRSPAELGAWSYVVATYDGATLALYIDGTFFASKPDARPLPPYSVAALTGANIVTSDHFGGDLDELAVYDHVVSAERIALHHAIGVHGP